MFVVIGRAVNLSVSQRVDESGLPRQSVICDLVYLSLYTAIRPLGHSRHCIA